MILERIDESMMVNQSKWDVLPLILLTLFPPINIDIWTVPGPFLLACSVTVNEIMHS